MKMRTLYLLWFLTTVSLTFTACGNDENTTEGTAGETEGLVLLPLFAKEGEATLPDVMRFEKARGSKSITLHDEQSIYCFATTNPEFPQVEYTTDVTGNYTEAWTATANLELEPEVHKAIEAQGFTKESSAYIHAEYPYTVTVKKGADSIVVSSVYTPIQDKAYPTFDSLPMLLQMAWTGFLPMVQPGTLDGDVKPWETAHGGIFCPEESNYVEDMKYVIFKPSEEDKAAGFVDRLYWVEDDLQTLTAVSFMYHKIDLVFWTPDNGKNYYTTKEFNKLIAEHGFILLYGSDKHDRAWMYVRPDAEGRGFMDVWAVMIFDEEPEGLTIDCQTFKLKDFVSGTPAIPHACMQRKGAEFAHHPHSSAIETSN